jgi:hypothetical protein
VTLPDLHLAEEALAAYVDGLLSPSADDRASRHLRACAECRAEVDAGREAKALLAATPDPVLPAGLLARLLDVPMSAPLDVPDGPLAVDGESFGFGGRVVERRATAPAPARPRGSVRPMGAARPAGRSARGRRTRRGLVVSLAGLAFGVIASAATTTAPGSAAPARPGEAPGPQTVRLQVGTTSPMDAGRTFLFRNNSPAARPTLVPSHPGR